MKHLCSCRHRRFLQLPIWHLSIVNYIDHGRHCVLYFSFHTRTLHTFRLGIFIKFDCTTTLNYVFLVSYLIFPSLSLSHSFPLVLCDSVWRCMRTNIFHLPFHFPLIVKALFFYLLLLNPYKYYKIQQHFNIIKMKRNNVSD